mgnify:CR=1 FL=1
MKILFACGGTAGHINPAIAVANYIKARHPDCQILFAGNPHGMEAKLVPNAGFQFAPIEIMGFQRQLNWFNFRYNLRSAGCFVLSWGRAKKMIRGFDPDIIVGTGGYVSGPVLREGHKLGYKTITHESNAFPGITTKLLAATTDKILLAAVPAEKPGICHYRKSGEGANYICRSGKSTRETWCGRPDLHCIIRRKLGGAPHQ